MWASAARFDILASSLASRQTVAGPSGSRMDLWFELVEGKRVEARATSDVHEIDQPQLLKLQVVNKYLIKLHVLNR